MQVLYALARLAFGDLVAGDWAKVRAAADESLALSTDIGVPALGVPPIGWLTLLAALQGNPEYGTLRAQLDAAVERHQLGVFADGVQDMSRWAAGVHAANEGDAVGALRHLARMRLPALSRMAAIDRIEAAIRANDHEQADLWVEQLSEFADATRWPWALAVVDHGRALLADPADAPALFESALKHHEHGGRRLRPGPHPPCSRRNCCAAANAAPMPARTCAPPRPSSRSSVPSRLLARAEQELRATGESARKRDPSTSDPAHADGVADRAAGRQRHVEQGGSRALLDLAANGRLPSAQRVQQDRNQLARGARQARRHRPGTRPLGRCPRTLTHHRRRPLLLPASPTTRRIDPPGGRSCHKGSGSTFSQSALAVRGRRRSQPANPVAVDLVRRRRDRDEHR